MDHVPALGWSRPLSLAEKLWRIDWLAVVVMTLIAGIGTATLYSVAGGSFVPLAERHAVRFLIGCMIVVAMALVRPRIFMHASYPAYVGALLLLTLVPVMGSEALGARRWLTFSWVSVQPSELMKVTLVAALARYYHWLPPERVSQPAWVAIPLVLIAFPVMLTLKQPDLGTAFLFVLIGLALMFFAGVSWLYFVGGGAIAYLVLPFVWDGLHGYQRKRIETFLDPDTDPLGAGYHISQSKIALGSGGIEGKGFMQGTQSRLEFLPERHTDFAFTMFGEEWGFVGSIGLLALYAVLIGLIVRMALNSQSQFGRLVAAGLAMTLFTYVFINVSMVTGLVPVVGVPLPLMSYGGSAMLCLMVALGLAMSPHVHGRKQPRREEIGPWW